MKKRGNEKQRKWVRHGLAYALVIPSPGFLMRGVKRSENEKGRQRNAVKMRKAEREIKTVEGMVVNPVKGR